MAFFLLGKAGAAAPIVVEVVPAAGATVNELAFIEVYFDVNVQGVDAADLLINGLPATQVTAFSPRDYAFTFPPPPLGWTQVAWAPDHGITDLAEVPQAFGGGDWTYTLAPPQTASTVIISEFMADNQNGLKDDDADRADWIELLNLGPDPVNLEGWYLTDAATNLTQWCFPAVNLNVNQYLLVWASEKNRTNPLAPLHTNFKLEKSGDYLALVDPQGRVVSDFGPRFPPQRANISYGRDKTSPSLTGFFYTPTPGAPNSTAGLGFAPEPVCSLDSGVYTNNTITVTLSAPAGEIRYTLDGAVPTTNSLLYASPLTFSGNAGLKARVFQADLLPSPVVARGYVLLDRSVAGFSSNLPVMILSTGGRGIAQDVGPGQPRTFAAVFSFEPFRGRSSLQAPPSFCGFGGVEIRGQSSTGFPKKAYNLEIQDAYRNDFSVPLLGLPSESDWALYNPYTDKPFLQNFIAYELFEKMGRYSVRRRFVEVFVDVNGGKVTYPTDYSGIYMLVEKIKISGHRVDVAKLSSYHTAEPEVTGGYIIKKDKDSRGDVGFSTSGGRGFSGQYLKMHDPKPREVTATQLAWIRGYLNRFETALYATNWLQATGTNHYSWYIDADSFVDNHWIVEFAKQIDGYRLSNYLHKDRGGKLKMSPIWDWNLSFGNADYLEGWRTNGWYYTQLGDNEHIWLRRLMCGTASSAGTSGDPDFNQRIADRWSELRTNILAASNVLARIDEMKGVLSEAAARDFAKWPRLGSYVWPNPSIYVSPRTYEGVVAAMKTWVQGRYTWIDTQFLRAPGYNLNPGLVPAGLGLRLSSPTGAIYFTLDGTDPRRAGGTIAPGATYYSGPVPLTTNARLFARVRSGARWSGPTVATFVVQAPRIAITEIMCHPVDPPFGSGFLDEDFEYVELANLGDAELNLAGYRLSGGLDFAFTNQTLAAGQRLVVVRNRAAFLSRYGAGPLVAGEYTGGLRNRGDRLVLTGALQEPIDEVAYREGSPLADGVGFSLVRADGGPTAQPGSPTRWRLSRAPGGSPGDADPPPLDFPQVVVSEVLTHTDPPDVDSLELHNLSDAPATLDGWFLTDNLSAPKKYRFPTHTVVPAGGFRVVTEADFNAPDHALDPFALSALGDHVYLLSGDADTNLTGYGHGFQFGAQRRGITFGRWVTSTGEEHLVAQAENTLGATNAGPLVGPVVLSQIMYHPPDVLTNNAYWNNTEDEYLELANASDNPAPLFDPDHPAHTWRLTQAIEFQFPTPLTLPPRSRLLLVSFNPDLDPVRLAAFRATYAAPEDVLILGPYRGSLDNHQETVALERPDAPVPSGPEAGQVPYVLVEQVRYADGPPWPVAADGLGYALHRREPAGYGNDPQAWYAAPPSPGRPPPAVAPRLAITSQPLSQPALNARTLTLSVAAEGPAPLRYQWRFNGAALPGATNASLVLTNLQLAQQGAYLVSVLSSSRSTDSLPAWVAVDTDADGDSMGDQWELVHGLNPYDPTDGPLDSDGDGVSNAQEYLAGTDPQDPRSFLRIDRLGVSGPATLSFTAVGARSYSVEFTDSLGPADWQRLAEVPGRATNYQAVVTDPASNPRRYYRLVTPAQP